MAVRITRFNSFTPESVELLDGKVYPCRQISAAGMELRERLAAGIPEGQSEVEILEECIQTVADLLGAPLPEVRRLNLTQLGFVLQNAAVPAELMQQALQEDAEKNGRSGAAKSPTPRKAKR